MTRKGGLGKGLNALIPGEETPASEGMVLQVPVEKLTPNPLQPRTVMDESDLQELAASIREHGILQPLIVTHDNGGDQYVLIAGERRLRAARMVGLETVPAIVRQASDQQRLELALIENVQRADLGALEKAEAYHQLSEEFGLSHEEIGVRVGKSREAVTNTMRLLKLPETVRAALAAGQISEGHARSLLRLATPQAQLAALQTILKWELNVRQAEELVKKLLGEKAPQREKKAPAAEVGALEERLRSQLGTKVTLRHGKKGGTLVIHYYSDEELNSLINQILKD
jgi:ParB family transcriptional regulator, chromosome partitioning protein